MPTINTRKFIALRKLTRALAETLRNDLRDTLMTVEPLLRPRTMFGEHIQGGGKDLIKGADRAFKDLATRKTPRNMVRLAEWAGAHIAPWQTPHEHAAALSQVTPDGEPSAQCIARVYSHERYGRNLPDLRDRSDVHYAWKALRPQLRRAILRRWIGRSSHQ